MKTLGFESADELAAYFEGLGHTALYRGQTKEYLGTDQLPKLSTSFSRKGCNPPQMLKWSYYAKSLLRAFAKGFDGESDLATTQAILQHYGWRSFFLDASSNPAVASWFAAHSFASKQVMNLAEDCWEEPAWLIHEEAWYTPFEGDPVVYVISKKALRAKNIQAVDLMEIATTTGHPRFLAQSAWMVGPFDDALPPDCIVAKVLAPAKVFAEFAARFQLRDDHDLFPEPERDPVLKALLSIPWVHRRNNNPNSEFFEFYSRGLPLPEYRWRVRKRMHSDVAFYRSFWLVNDLGTANLFHGAAHFLSPEYFFHGEAVFEAISFTKLGSMLRRHRSLVIDMDGLLRYPTGEKDRYGKGVFLTLDDADNGLVHVSELFVTHPGMRPRRYGVLDGRSYRIGSDNRWKREMHPIDCPCHDDAQHERLHVMIARVEADLKEREYRRVREGVYAHNDVDPASNLRHLQPEGQQAVPYFAEAL